MPIYEYACDSCGHEFEKLQKISAPAPECPSCGDGVRKKVSRTSFQLKGAGWYTTDYKSAPGSKGGSTTTSTASSTSESSSSESVSTGGCGGGCACHSGTA